MIPTLEGTVIASDDRRVAYSLAGPSHGLPVVYLHGGIGTPIRLAPQLGEVIGRLGLRHVAISRPGFGGSDPAPGRRILDFPSDLERVADHLGLERFALVGISSGGPYALATARALGDRVAAVGVVSCLSPLEAPHESRAMRPHLRAVLRALVERPRLVERCATGVLAAVEHNRHLVMRLALLCASRSDRRTLGDARALDGAMAAFLQSASSGVRGMLEDYALCCAPWGFSLSEISHRVNLWHGAGDDFVPLPHARALAARLPSCRAQIGTDDGHFFYRRRMAAVLEVIASEARASQVPAPTQDVPAGTRTPEHVPAGTRTPEDVPAGTRRLALPAAA